MYASGNSVGRSGVNNNSNNRTIVDENSNEQYDVSIHPICWVLSCPLIHCGICPYKTTLTLEKEQAVREDHALCGKRISERPYGELGSVEKGFFCCFVCVDSNLGTIISGWGCDDDQADIILIALQERMRRRGDTGQIQLSEKIVRKANDIFDKVELISKHLKAPETNAMEDR